MKPIDNKNQTEEFGQLAKGVEYESEEIRKSAEVLIDSDGKPSKYREGLLRDIVKRTRNLDLIAQKVQSYIQTLTAANRMSSNTVALADVVRECIEKSKPDLEKHSTNVRVFVDSEIRVKMDAGIIRPILQELFANAISHNPPLSWIKIEAHSVMDEIVVTVKDCGTGISKDDLAKIFEKKSVPFSSKAQKIFGLPEIRQILQSYGHKIWANSAYGKGTTIYLTLPAAH